MTNISITRIVLQTLGTMSIADIRHHIMHNLYYTNTLIPIMIDRINYLKKTYGTSIFGSHFYHSVGTNCL